mgnify:CR=1 FL=1
MMDILNNPAVAYLLLLIIGALLAWIGRHLKEGKLRDAVKMAASTAAGLAYAYRADRAQRGEPVTQRAAVAVGVEYLSTRMPDAMQHFGIGNEAAIDMVTGELGKLLAADPTVTVLPVVAKVAA